MAALLVGTLPVGVCIAQGDVQSGIPLQVFLRNYLKDGSSSEDTTTRYSIAPVALHDSMQVILVYITGRRWCGSGGCTALLLKPEGSSSFKVIDRFTLVRLPIRILPSETNGWHDLAVWVEGGGVSPGYAAVLRFDGRKYPTNPSTAPAFNSAGLPDTAITLPLKEDGAFLYQ
jgi:hypothetical protein